MQAGRDLLSKLYILLVERRLVNLEDLLSIELLFTYSLLVEIVYGGIQKVCGLNDSFPWLQPPTSLCDLPAVRAWSLEVNLEWSSWLSLV